MQKVHCNPTAVTLNQGNWEMLPLM